MTTLDSHSPTDIEQTLREAISNDGQSLYELSHESAVLLNFMRHFGCVFCQSKVAELAELARPLDVGGVRLAFVHMESEQQAGDFFGSYGLGDAPRFQDPDRALYKAFELHRGRVGQIYGGSVIASALKLILTGKAKIGPNTADYMQMPGSFLLHRGKIERSFRPARINERPDYAELADCTICDIDFQAETK